MKQFRALSLLLVLTVLAACAPAAGRPTIPYLAPSSEVIGAIAQVGPQLRPGGAYNFLGIETIGDNFITLVADKRPDSQILGSLTGSANTVSLTLTTIQNGEVTQVATSGLPRDNSVVNRMLDTIIQELDNRFQRAPQAQ